MDGIYESRNRAEHKYPEQKYPGPGKYPILKNPSPKISWHKISPNKISWFKNIPSQKMAVWLG